MANEMPFPPGAPTGGDDEMASELEEEEEEEFPIGEELAGEELEGMEEDAMGPPASLEEGVASLLEAWQPTTPEGEQYKADLEGVLGEVGGGLEEELMTEEESGGPMGLADLRNSVAAKLGPMLGGPQG
jgi:hypothetical protein